MTRDEIATSADVFPIEWLDVRERHLLLEGEDVLSGIVVDHECLRRQIEHELRGKHLRLRMMWWLHASRPADLRRALLMQTSGWNAVLRALLRLDGEAAPASHEATVDRVAERHGLSAAALHGALQLRTTRQRVSDAEAKQRYRDFLVEVERLVAIVDGLPA